MKTLDELFSAWLSGPLSEDEARQLQEALRDPAGRRRWRALADLEGALAERGSAIAAEPAQASPVTTRRLRVSKARRPQRNVVWPWAVAAILLLSCGLAWTLSQPALDSQPDSQPQSQPEPVVRVANVPPALVIERDLPAIGNRHLARGDVIAGPAEVRWPDGSVGHLATLAQARVPAVGHGLDLLTGDLTVVAAHQISGPAFTVVSTHATSIVKGTRFSLRCDALSTTLSVEVGTVSFQARGGEPRLIAAGGQAVAGSAPPTSAGLVGWWPLDEGTGTAARDASGQGHPGRIAGPQWTGQGLHFSGENEHVVIPAVGRLATVQDSDYSIAAWYRPDVLPPGGTPPNRDAMAVIAGRSGWTLGLHLTHEGRFFMQHFLADQQPQAADSSALAVAGRWYHVAGMVSRRLGRTWLAIDGAMVPSPATWTPGAAGNAYAATQPWIIGISTPHDPACRWPAQGIIRDVRLYDRALDGHEVLGLAQSR